MSNDKQEATGKQFYETADKIITVEKQERSYSEEDTREKPLNQNKITAVEWLVEELKKSTNYRGLQNIGITHQELIDQAKEMEKRQKNNLPIVIHEGIENTWVYIEDGIVHVKPNPKANEQQ